MLCQSKIMNTEFKVPQFQCASTKSAAIFKRVFCQLFKTHSKWTWNSAICSGWYASIQATKISPIILSILEGSAFFKKIICIHIVYFYPKKNLRIVFWTFFSFKLIFYWSANKCKCPKIGWIPIFMDEHKTFRRAFLYSKDTKLIKFYYNT